MSEDPKEIDVYALAREMGIDPKKGQGKTGRLGEEEGLSEKLATLTEKYEELYFLSRAMWSLLREKTDLQEQDLQDRLAQVRADHSLATKPKAERCPDCDRPLQRIEGKHHRCIYCGYIQEFNSPFDRLL